MCAQEALDRHMQALQEKDTIVQRLQKALAEKEHMLEVGWSCTSVHVLAGVEWGRGGGGEFSHRYLLWKEKK